jgi:hypothetical protein
MGNMPYQLGQSLSTTSLYNSGWLDDSAKVLDPERAVETVYQFSMIAYLLLYADYHNVLADFTLLSSGWMHILA